MANKIDILVVEPGEAPRPAKVEDTLEAFQQIVGGPIEAGCYLPQRVMLICNGEGKHMGLCGEGQELGRGVARCHVVQPPISGVDSIVRLVHVLLPV